MQDKVIANCFFIFVLMMGALIVALSPEILSAGECRAISVEIDHTTGMEQVHMNQC